MADKKMEAQISVEFEEATSRQSLNSGETINTLWSKVKRWLSDLKAVAFSGSYNDLSDIPVEMTGATSSSTGTSGLVPAPASGKQASYLRGDGTWAVPEKLASSSYTTITINTSDWGTNSDGGFMYIASVTDLPDYTNFNIDILLSSDQDAAKLQLESWSYIIGDGNIIRHVSTDETMTIGFIFYAFTTKPSVALTIGIQGVS